MTRPSVLFVTTSSNWPLTDGKRQRTWFLIEALSKKYDVDLLLIGFESDKKQVEESTSSVKNLYYIDLKDSIFFQPGYPSLLLSKKEKEKKAIFFQEIKEFLTFNDVENKYSFLFSRYLQPLFAMPFLSKIKVVCDIDDVYFEVQKSRIQKEALFLRKIKLQVLFFLGSAKIKKVLKQLTVPIIVKESDRSFFGLQNAVCLPNLPFGFYINPKISPFPTIITQPQELQFGFIGKLSYRPNYQGLIDFIHSVWNPIMQTEFNARFIIAGSGEIPEELRKVIESSKNIVLLGFVESAKLFWNQISVLVVPIAEGGGSNIKIAEAFINGKTVIAHQFSARGYDSFFNDSCLYIPQTNKDWIQVMTSLQQPSNEQIEATAIKARSLFDLENWNQTFLDAIN